MGQIPIIQMGFVENLGLKHPRLSDRIKTHSANFLESDSLLKLLIPFGDWERESREQRQDGVLAQTQDEQRERLFAKHKVRMPNWEVLVESPSYYYTPTTVEARFAFE